MPAVYDFQKLLTMLVATYQADATLISLLGGSSSIWLEEPEGDFIFPLIHIRVETAVADKSASYGGSVFRGTIRHRIFHEVGPAGLNIATYLDQNFKIPQILTTGIEDGENWRLTQYAQENAFTLPDKVRTHWLSKAVYATITDWDFRAHQLTQS